MKGLKRISLLSVALLSTVGLSTLVKADKVCTTYKDYYFFSRLNQASLVKNSNNGYYTGESGLWEDTSSTNYPTSWYDDLKTKLEGDIIEKRICLKKGDKIDGVSSSCNNNYWELKDFYEKEIEIANDGKIENFATESGERQYTILEEKSTDNNKNVISRYYMHGKWARDDVSGESTTSYLTDGTTADTLVKISALAMKYLEDKNAEGVSFASNLITSPEIKITRKYYIDDYADAVTEAEKTENNISWGENGKLPAVISPALYYIEYTLCEKYNATINYWYKEDNTKAADSWTEENLDDDYEEEVPSPEIKNCTPDLKSVNVKITDPDAKDVGPVNREYNVYYTCKTDAEGKQEPTGDALIYLAWAIGLGAIGYSVYYFRSLKKEKI